MKFTALQLSDYIRTKLKKKSIINQASQSWNLETKRAGKIKLENANLIKKQMERKIKLTTKNYIDDSFENDQSMHKVKRFLNWEEWKKS